ncbi:unnamed protein product, partial [Iphiclides podalirius]
MEELLGISSKRLCAILDGAEPPSDTESSSTSSSPEKLETISLDSISSDEEILSEGSNKKKKHKHRRHASKSKSKHKRKSSSDKSENGEDRSKASRAGLTVLELLELQARARAIRAQLQQEQATADVTDLTGAPHVSDDEVEIKEEPAEVVEISSEDEKPKLEELQKEIEQTSNNTTEPSNQETQTVTKRINDLIITVPQTKPTRKIKLNRNKALVQNPSDSNIKSNKNILAPSNINAAGKEKEDDSQSKVSIVDSSNKPQKAPENTNAKKSDSSTKIAAKEKQKKRQKKKGKQKSSNKDGSDHDEITLELSDSEKMDLLEDLDRKNFDNVSSSCTEDSESSSDSEDDGDSTKDKSSSKSVEISKRNSDKDPINSTNKDTHVSKDSEETEAHMQILENVENKNVTQEDPKEVTESDNKEQQNVEHAEVVENSSVIPNNQVIEVTTLEDIPIRDDSPNLPDVSENLQNCSITEKGDNETPKKDNEAEIGGESNKPEATDTLKVANRDLSEGELSDRESSEVEASDVKPEVVYISDDESKNKKGHKKKKNKKKEKKAKKEKKSKKFPDFRKDGDQNFFKESNAIIVTTEDLVTSQPNNNPTAETISIGDDDVYEILELSSDSSCNEEGGNTVLSKEPTAQEIEALSAKIDEIEREDVVTEEQIKEHERLETEKNAEDDIQNVSWKDRYLDSKKVRSVLSTSNIFNAMRKKNLELKRKMQEAKRETMVVPSEVIEANPQTNLEEGSIEHYNTLEGSTKYVDPIREVEGLQEKEDANQEMAEGQVTKEMKKDAKQLLKMYKKLLKYNDMNRQRNPNKKKKKKQKKNKDEKNISEPNKEIKIVS